MMNGPYLQISEIIEGIFGYHKLQIRMPPLNEDINERDEKHEKEGRDSHCEWVNQIIPPSSLCSCNQHYTLSWVLYLRLVICYIL